MFHTADMATWQDEQNGIRANDTEASIDKIAILSTVSDNVSCDIKDTNILHCIPESRREIS
jgi:hypothetical protein